MRRKTARRGHSLVKQGEPLKSAGQRQRQKWRKVQRHRKRPLTAACAEGLGTPQGCAPAKDGSTTWSRTRPKEKTPMKRVAGLMRTTRHPNWGTLAAIFSVRVFGIRQCFCICVCVYVRFNDKEDFSGEAHYEQVSDVYRKVRDVRRGLLHVPRNAPFRDHQNSSTGHFGPMLHHDLATTQLLSMLLIAGS